MDHLFFNKLHILALLLSFAGCFALPIQACSWDYPIWQIRNKDADPYYRFIHNGKVGYIDILGTTVVPPSTVTFRGGNYGGEFHNGLLLAGGWDGPYIDATGKVVLDAGLYRNWSFSDGLAAAMRTDRENRWGYIDRTGKFVIEPKFESHPNGYVHPFSNGLAMIEVQHRFGFIDTKGQFVILPTYLWAHGFSEDRARVIVDGPCIRPGFEDPCDWGETLGKVTEGQKAPSCKFGFIDRSGSLIGMTEYEDAGDFSEGFAAVQKDGKWGFIDKTGKLVIQFKFGQVGSFSDGLARVAVGGRWDEKRWGYIDREGKIVIAFQFERAEEFSDGLAPVANKAFANSAKERWYYIEKNGKRAFPSNYVVASPFFKGLAHVKLIGRSQENDFYLSGKFAYIDTKGRTVFSYERRSDED